MGLAAVYGLIEGMGGTIHVESVLGEGSAFSVLLLAASARVTTQAEALNQLPRGNERILLVDDQTEVANTLRRQLIRLGHQEDAFNAPGLAQERFRMIPDVYELLITDMVMPDMNGQELAEAMRLTRKNLRVMLCSAHRFEGADLSEDVPVLTQ